MYGAFLIAIYRDWNQQRIEKLFQEADESLIKRNLAKFELHIEKIRRNKRINKDIPGAISEIFKNVEIWIQRSTGTSRKKVEILL